MADALVSVVLEQLTSVLKDAEQEIQMVVGVRDEIGKLTTTLTMVQAVLEDAEKKQVKDKGIKLWLERLNDLVYDADDVLDEWNTKGADIDPPVSGIHKKVLSYVLSSCFGFENAYVRHTIGHKIKKIREDLEVIAHDKDQFNLTLSHSHKEIRYLTSSVVDVPLIFGRDADKEFVISRLLGESSHQEMHVPVISIVGMGGFGKTTLAKLVLKDSRVIANFENMIWVCVSEPFDLIGAAKQIIVQAGGQVPAIDGWESLHRSLCDSLKGKRFILVLDDVWTHDPNLWNPLKVSLNGGAPGSKLVVTTRDEGVATMMGSTYIYRLGQLSKEDCWALFRSIAFSGRENEFSKFKDIGKEIAEKCKGVPLAVKTLASLMCFKRTKLEWRNVLTSDMWEQVEVAKDLLPSLFMSYYDLSSPLRRCLMYCAIFPKDAEIVKAGLVQLWMAHGYLGSDERRDLESMGGEYFDILARRSFFQDFEEDSDGNIRSCKMHDLVHDFVQFLTKREFCIVENDNELNVTGVRHLSASKLENISSYSAKKLRSLVIDTPSLPAELFNQLTCLRALDLSCGDFEELPSEVKKLLHLRYLDLSWTNFTELPETVCDLHNLQTLKLNNCRNLCKLPEGTGKISSLRHLEMQETDALRYLPQGIGKLNLLRTLSKFTIGGGCNIGELKHLNFLQGRLYICGLEQVTDKNEVAQAELKQKKNLGALSLLFNYLEVCDAGKETDVLENLRPHESLEELNIVGFKGSHFPSWISSISANLLKLKLYRCKYCSELPALGKLPSLEMLEIIELSSVKHIGSEFYGLKDVGIFSGAGSTVVAFPKLEILEFLNMEQWEEWKLPISLDRKIMPCLSKLTLYDCPKLKALPGLGKLESLESLEVNILSSVKMVGLEFLGISDDGDDSYRSKVDGEDVMQNVIFSRLTNLFFGNMKEWEVWKFPLVHKRDGGLLVIMPCIRKLRLLNCPKLRTIPCLTNLTSLETIHFDYLSSAEFSESEEAVSNTIGGERGYIKLPCLRQLHFEYCITLKAIPQYMLSDTLRKLEIHKCPKLTGIQPRIPSLLEHLVLRWDVGVFSRSLPLNSSNCPNLRSFSIIYSLHSSLPEGFNQLTAIQQLEFCGCANLDFDLNELKHLTVLQQLIVYKSPMLEERFRKGEDWRSILSHVPYIEINDKEITGNN
ncbi:hypothetical protein ACHQM5_010401 [Ranunculus cassubicifolius]